MIELKVTLERSRQNLQCDGCFFKSHGGCSMYSAGVTHCDGYTIFIVKKMEKI